MLIKKDIFLAISIMYSVIVLSAFNSIEFPFIHTTGLFAALLISIEGSLSSILLLLDKTGEKIVEACNDIISTTNEIKVKNDKDLEKSTINKIEIFMIYVVGFILGFSYFIILYLLYYNTLYFSIFAVHMVLWSLGMIKIIKYVKSQRK